MVTHRWIPFGPFAGLLLVGLALLMMNGSGLAQVKKGKTHLAATKYLMRGVMQPNCAALGKLLNNLLPNRRQIIFIQMNRGKGR